MKLHSFKFVIAAGLTTTIIWLICSFLVFSMPQMTLMISGDMIHINTQEMMWSLALSGFIKGLIIW
ncbi:DUF5676 family membrane protein [Methylophaga sp.]|uniref:DUF5676 family membrane protein n=1 Tax=Methylophaga TaxID=40222 RepID=UPI0039AFB91F